MINLFIFRRDLRTFDNTALNNLINKYPNIDILPIFIFNKKQIDKNSNPFYSHNSVQFMFECFNDIPSLNFYYTSTNDIQILNILKSKFKINAIGYNKDYTKFAIERDEEINKWCSLNEIDIITGDDYTLHKMGTILKDDKQAYLKFTPFYKKGILIKPLAIKDNYKNNFIIDKSNKFNFNSLIPEKNKDIIVNGGRNNALNILKNLKEGKFNNYDKDRDYPYLDKTTKLSAYIKFGCISIREVYYSLPINHGIIRELFWHDFYAYITYYFPERFSKSFIPKYDNFKWNINDINKFDKWKNGKTGFPLIDASMRQLNKIGWCHNRCRMIVASFLTKNLFIDWKWGEKYFASKLVDYDPSSNNGGWKWCASIGTDAQPYFRIFSPSVQLKKYDKDCLYIKKWVEELRDVDNKIILNWENLKNYDNYKYNKPIIDFKQSSKDFINKFKSISF